MTFMATLPIILPVWQEKPMPRGFLQIERTGFYSTPEELAYQSKAFKSNDRALILKTLANIQKIQTPDASKIVYTYLSSAKDPVMRTTAIKYLYDMPIIEEKINTVETLMNNQVAEGIAAARLYVKFKQAKLNKVFSLVHGTSMPNKISLAQALADAQRASADQWLPHYSKDNSMSLQKLVLGNIAASPKQSAKSLAFIKKILSSNDTIAKVFLATSLVNNKQTALFFKQMSSEKHASIRQAAARGMGVLPKSEYEPLLVKMTRDSDTEVRKTATRSLHAYKTNSAIEALSEVFKDAELLNQKAAVESLMHLSTQVDISTIVSKHIDGRLSGQRRWSAHILGNLTKKIYTNAIDAALFKEKDADAKSQQIYALGQFKHRLDTKLVTTLSKDNSSRVRRALMTYIGKINDQKLFPFIHNAAVKDHANDVRGAALTACGNNGSPWFNKTLIHIMYDLDINKPRNSMDRACASWAAGKIRGLDKKMYDQMKLFIQKPMIPMEMGPPAYDNPQVLISITFAFVDQAKMGDNNERKYAKYALSFVKKFQGGRGVEFPRSSQNRYFALQAKHYLENLPVQPKNMRSRKIHWSIAPIKKN